MLPLSYKFVIRLIQTIYEHIWLHFRANEKVMSRSSAQGESISSSTLCSLKCLTCKSKVYLFMKGTFFCIFELEDTLSHSSPVRVHHFVYSLSSGWAVLIIHFSFALFQVAPVEMICLFGICRHFHFTIHPSSEGTGAWPCGRQKKNATVWYPGARKQAFVWSGTCLDYAARIQNRGMDVVREVSDLAWSPACWLLVWRSPKLGLPGCFPATLSRFLGGWACFPGGDNKGVKRASRPIPI